MYTGLRSMIMKDLKIGLSAIVVFGMIIGLGISCTNYTIPDKNNIRISAASCEGCHTDYERLIEVHSPDTGAPAGGCGGTAPHYEPYDRVFMGGEGYDAYKESGHYSIGCTGCHNGEGKTGDKDLAHSGDFMRHHSMFYEDKCTTCHKDITDNFTTSIHNGTGQKRKVAMRSGLSGPEEFDQLPAHQIEGYNDNFDAFPMYNYTTPHNILRWTSRTNDAGGSCSMNCHIRKQGDSLVNKNLYLFMEDLEEDWEISSTSHITVDGELPSWWPTE